MVVVQAIPSINGHNGFIQTFRTPPLTNVYNDLDVGTTSVARPQAPCKVKSPSSYRIYSSELSPAKPAYQKHYQ
jgi:hypothetical protein